MVDICHCAILCEIIVRASEDTVKPKDKRGLGYLTLPIGLSPKKKMNVNYYMSK
jgi:hypothetical protein